MSNSKNTDSPKIKNGKTRSQMRIEVFCSIYQFLLNPDEMVELENGYEQNVYLGVLKNIDHLQKLISDHALGFKQQRLFKVDLSILLVAVFELLYCPEIPHQVIIDQALEIAKQYSTQKSSSFINGVLGSILDSIDRQGKN
ncbi:MAG: transcription antitermination factor NusB [Clostridiales bacterium]|jgi:N utilization substance protein B|nr:transcription antitermination factor NusB [Clostridiales bacterium]